MPRLIALLRAINVGRGRVVRMDDLRRLFESLGFRDVATFIASGNVAFVGRAQNAAALERRIGRRLRDAFGYDVTVFIRTPEELAAIAAFRPFPRAPAGADVSVNVLFLAEPPDTDAKRRVLALGTSVDDFRVRGREVYWRRRRRPGGPPFSTVPLEKALRRSFTIRNDRTVKTLAAMYAAQRGEKTDAKAAVPVRAHDLGRDQRRGARRPRGADAGRDG